MTAPPRTARQAAGPLTGCVLGLLALAVTGCGGPGVGQIDGTVTANGVPVTYGTVTVVGDDGIPHQGNIEPDGTYSVKKVPTGTAKIMVVSPEPPTKPSTRPSVIGPGDNPARYPRQSAELAAKVDWRKWRPIPKKYADLKTSDLTVEVGAGRNKHDIELK